MEVKEQPYREGELQQPAEEAQAHEASPSNEHEDVRKLWDYLRDRIERGDIPKRASDPQEYERLILMRRRINQVLGDDPEYRRWCDEWNAKLDEDPQMQAATARDIERLRKIVASDHKSGRSVIN